MVTSVVCDRRSFRNADAVSVVDVSSMYVSKETLTKIPDTKAARFTAFTDANGFCRQLHDVNVLI